ncbi:MAG TPA: hypothetical protein VJV79_33880 [Polyangiaceae bacterium]|nr:hypothetical protein [Polyangiaceae bacterium]
MKSLSPARKASLGMTAVLGIAVAAGAGSALFNAHSAPAGALRPEGPAREQAKPASTAPNDEEGSALRGSVLETMAASQYTYLRLATSNGEIWAAVPSTTIAVGAQVTVSNATKMTAFKSATLKRTFDVIYFGTLSTAATQQATAPRFSPADALAIDDQQDLPPGHPDISNAPLGARSGGSTDALPAGHPSIDGAAASPHAPSPAGSGSTLPALAVAPARGSNARAIAQLSSQRAQLAGQRVRVRGQVTKVTAGVQGHTFFHLRDGKPDDPEPSDLVVTSDATPERGQVATFEGTLRTNVDIGIGYSYPILLENAVLIAE